MLVVMWGDLLLWHVMWGDLLMSRSDGAHRSETQIASRATQSSLCAHRGNTARLLEPYHGILVTNSTNKYSCRYEWWSKSDSSSDSFLRWGWSDNKWLESDTSYGSLGDDDDHHYDDDDPGLRQLSAPLPARHQCREWDRPQTRRGGNREQEHFKVGQIYTYIF